MQEATGSQLATWLGSAFAHLSILAQPILHLRECEEAWLDSLEHLKVQLDMLRPLREHQLEEAVKAEVGAAGGWVRHHGDSFCEDDVRLDGGDLVRLEGGLEATERAARVHPRLRRYARLVQ